MDAFPVEVLSIILHHVILYTFKQDGGGLIDATQTDTSEDTEVPSDLSRICSRSNEQASSIFGLMRTCKLWANITHQILWRNEWDWIATDVYETTGSGGQQFHPLRTFVKRRDLGSEPRCEYAGKNSNAQSFNDRWREMLQCFRGPLSLWCLFYSPDNEKLWKAESSVDGVDSGSSGAMQPVDDDL